MYTKSGSCKANDFWWVVSAMHDFRPEQRFLVRPGRIDGKSLIDSNFYLIRCGLSPYALKLSADGSAAAGLTHKVKVSCNSFQSFMRTAASLGQIKRDSSLGQFR